jgi:hypothetical protein
VITLLALITLLSIIGFFLGLITDAHHDSFLDGFFAPFLLAGIGFFSYGIVLAFKWSIGILWA